MKELKRMIKAISLEVVACAIKNLSLDSNVESSTIIKYNVQNFSALSSLTPILNEYAYVRESQGTSWLPGGFGGNYYGSGLYMWDGVEWKEDDTDVFIQLQSILETMASNIWFNEGTINIADGTTNFYTEKSVGIGGAITPTEKLDVNGNINMPNDGIIKLAGDDFIKWRDDAANSSLSIGKNTGDVTTVTGSTFIGKYAGQGNLAAAVNTTAIGRFAGDGNQGYQLTAVGSGAGRFQRGLIVTAIGSGAGGGNHGNYSVFAGYNAGSSNRGDNVLGIGYGAAQSNLGDNVTSFGTFSGVDNEGDNVTAIGVYAGQNNIGDDGVFMGYQAGRNNTGINGMFLGYEAGKDNTIANQFIVKQNNINTTPLIQGDFLAGNVGIGNTDPATTLDIDGALTIRPLSADPADPAIGASVQWISDGTGSGDAGDVLMKINVGGTIKIITIIDYSEI